MHQAKVEFTQPNPTSNTVHQVTVECTTEASPKAITYWVFKVDCSLFRNNTKECNHLLAVQGCDDPPVSAPPHRGGGRGLPPALQAHHPPGASQSSFTRFTLCLLQVTRSDFGAYKCVSKNSLGETEGQIRLYEIASESTVATPSPTEPTSRERPVRPTTRSL